MKLEIELNISLDDAIKQLNSQRPLTKELKN